MYFMTTTTETKSLAALLSTYVAFSVNTLPLHKLAQDIDARRQVIADTADTIEREAADMRRRVLAGQRVASNPMARSSIVDLPAVLAELETMYDLFWMFLQVTSPAARVCMSSEWGQS